MKQEIMAKDRPIGLVVFSIFLALAGLSTVRILFISEPQIVFLNVIFKGGLYKTYYLGMGILCIAISVGVLELKKWSYIWFTILTGYFLLTSIINCIFTKHESLIHLGWDFTENNMRNYYILQGFSILISLSIFLWLHRYRRILNK